MVEEQIILNVIESSSADVGHGRSRISKWAMKQLGLKDYDIIELIGTTNSSSAVVVIGFSGPDTDKMKIMMDNLTRTNVGVTLGEKIMVKKAITTEAEHVVLAPVLSDRKPINYADNIHDFVLARLLNRPLVVGDTLYIPGMNLLTGGKTVSFRVVTTFPAGIVSIAQNTVINLRKEPDPGDFSGIRSYEDIGGLTNEITRIRELIELPLKHPEVFEKLGITPPSGVLLHGPPGTGKTLIAKAVAVESGANFVSVQGPEIMDMYYGQSEAKLREKFETAMEEKPSSIFIDEIDSIAPKREDVSGEVERRVVAQLLTLMDGLTRRERVVVIAATNRVDAIDPALRRPGRFDREIEIGVPDKLGRRGILEIHSRLLPGKEELDLDYLAEHTHGFVGADLSSLVQEAAMRALRRFIAIHKIDLNRTIPIDLLHSLQVTMEDFTFSLREVEPSALREVLIDTPDVEWEQIGGLDDIKKRLRQAVEWPVNHPESFRNLGIRPPRGILLYGPPGTGKTLLAMAVSSQAGANFISIKGPEVISKWVGDSEKAIRDIFKKARQAAPSIVFLDEIDAIASTRSLNSGGSRIDERLVNQLLTSIDGMESNDGVVVMASTNRPELVDPALLRAGRFDKLLYVGPPSMEERLDILRIHTKEMPLANDIDLSAIAKQLEGFVGADVEALCQEAGITAMSEDFNASVVNKAHFEAATKQVRPSVTPEVMDYYERLSRSLKGDIRKIRENEFQVSYG